jgi:imidazolonepropionase-like amidohydrolase
MRLLLLALTLASAPLAAQTQPPQPVVIRGARVFDGTTMIGIRDVLVQNGLIARVAGSIATPPGATVVDGRGKTLLPGFIDAHTHTFQDVLRQALAFGVTTQLEMFTDPNVARMWRDEQKKGFATDRADVFSAGILVTSPNGHGTQFGMRIPTISVPDSAQAFVDARVAEGSDYIKIVYDDGAAYALHRATIDKPTMCAVVAAAHARGKLAVVHVGAATGSRDALDCAADGLVHIHADRDVAADAEVLRLAKARGAFVIPTLSVNMSVTGTAGGAGLLKDPRIEPALTRADLAALAQAFPTRPASRVRYAFAESTVARLRGAGVPIVAGTDAPNPGTAHGVSMHGELELLVRAGLAPTEALAAATAVPARVFRLADRGRIAPGLRADLILVDGDPTADITATRAITSIWKGGVPFDRAAYVKRAAATRTVAASGPPPGSETGEVSSFDDGTTRSKFGSAWEASSDQMAGGKSAGTVDVVGGGANGSAGALRIRGTIDPALPYAWAGAAFGPGTAPMQPANLSAKREIAFLARGDGKTYRVMLFAQSKGMTPMVKTFESTAEWKEFSFPLASFGTDGKDVILILIAGGPAAGPFELFVDEVRLR